MAWFDADQITSLSDGDPVSTWPDESGNANDATGSGSARPLYKTAILNGLPVVRFDNVDDVLDTPLSVSSPYTVMVVYNCGETGGFHRAVQGSNNWLMGAYGGFHQLFNDAFIQGPSVSTNVFVKAIGLSGGGTAELRVDGTSAGTNSNTTGPGTFYLGAGGTSPGEPVFGDIAEIAVYSRKLTTGECVALEAYILTKYGF